MFGKKKEICCICNQNEGAKKIIEGMICKECISKCGHFLLTLNWKGISSEHVKQAIYANQVNEENIGLFHSTNKFKNYLDLDENNRLWKVPCFLPNLVFSYDDIISYELLQNGTAITKGGLGSTLAGGMLFGGVGAIVGSNIGNKKTKQEINEYRIKIVTKNICYPEIYINLLTTGKVKSNSILYKACTDNAQHILSLLTIMTNASSNNRETLAVDVPNEIKKYKNLLDEGIITQEEFDTKKTQLLNM